MDSAIEGHGGWGKEEAYRPLILLATDPAPNSFQSFLIPLFKPHGAFNSQPYLSQETHTHTQTPLKHKYVLSGFGKSCFFFFHGEFQGNSLKDFMYYKLKVTEQIFGESCLSLIAPFCFKDKEMKLGEVGIYVKDRR